MTRPRSDEGDGVDSATQPFDVVIRGGRVLDPSRSVDAVADVGIRGDRIVAVGPDLDVGHAAVVDATRRLVCPGLVDLHVHGFEWATDFGLPPDDVGINAGVTTAVDMGSAGAWSFPAWCHHIADRSVTELFAFINVTLIGSMQAGRGGPNVFQPNFVSAEAIVSMYARYPERLRGIKTYAESGGWSQGWGEPFLQQAMQAAERTGLPVYIHTGELLAVDEANRPDPDEVMPTILAAARPGDILGHCYSGMPDGVLGRHRRPTGDLRSVVEAGILLDVGHGLNFSFETARRMIDGGLLPDIISSDVHCALAGVHDESPLTWSLVGTMSKLLALGVPLEKVIEASTAAPAAVIGMADDIGTLAPGTRADITILEELEGEWVFVDSSDDRLTTHRRLVPTTVVRAGRPITPTRRLLRDVLPSAERGEPVDAPSGSE